jgi:hypothetical protein
VVVPALHQHRAGLPHASPEVVSVVYAGESTVLVNVAGFCDAADLAAGSQNVLCRGGQRGSCSLAVVGEESRAHSRGHRQARDLIPEVCADGRQKSLDLPDKEPTGPRLPPWRRGGTQPPRGARRSGPRWRWRLDLQCGGPWCALLCWSRGGRCARGHCLSEKGACHSGPRRESAGRRGRRQGPWTILSCTRSSGPPG